MEGCHRKELKREEDEGATGACRTPAGVVDVLSDQCEETPGRPPDSHKTVDRHGPRIPEIEPSILVTEKEGRKSQKESLKKILLGIGHWAFVYLQCPMPNAQAHFYVFLLDVHLVWPR